MYRSTAAVVSAVAALACGAGAAFAGASSEAGLPRGAQLVATIGIPEGSGGMAVGQSAVWALSDDVSTLARITPQGNRATATIKVASVRPCPQYVCGEPAVGGGALWVPRAADNAVYRIDIGGDTVATTIRVGRYPVAVAVTKGAVWVLNALGPSLSRIDPATNEVVATIKLAPLSAAGDRGHVVAGGGAVWATVPNLKSVVRVDPSTNKVTARITVSDGPCGHIAADSRSVWVSGAHCAPTVMRIDPRTNKQTGSVKGLAAPIGLALGLGSLWAADLDAKALVRIDPRTGRVVGRLPVGGFPVRLGVGFGAVWLRDDTGRVLRIRAQG